MRVAVLGHIAHAYVVVVDGEFDVDSHLPRHLSPTSDSDGDTHGVSDPGTKPGRFHRRSPGSLTPWSPHHWALAGYRTAAENAAGREPAPTWSSWKPSAVNVFAETA